MRDDAKVKGFFVYLFFTDHWFYSVRMLELRESDLMLRKLVEETDGDLLAIAGILGVSVAAVSGRLNRQRQKKWWTRYKKERSKRRARERNARSNARYRARLRGAPDPIP